MPTIIDGSASATFATPLPLGEGGTGSAVGALSGPNGSAFALRNRIINGDMRIDQRNGGAAVTPIDGQYVVDRFKYNLSQASRITAQQSSVAPSGFSHSHLSTVTTAVAVTGSDYFMFSQRIEGFNFADLAWGTASAKTITISFWVRSSLTGTFGGSLTNAAESRSYPFTYVINSANTWEQKTVSVAGDTTGTWVGSTNGIGLVLWIGLGVGPTISGTAGAWAGATFYSATGATTVIGTSGATFYITGVQLEEGTVATPFERRPIGLELALCQRYCFVPLSLPLFSLAWVTGAAVVQGGAISLPVRMRVAPTITGVTTVTIQGVTSNGLGFALGASQDYMSLGSSNQNGLTDGVLRAVQPNQLPTFSAEL